MGVPLNWNFAWEAQMLKSSEEKTIFAGKSDSRRISADLKLCPPISEEPTEEFRMQILEKTKQTPWQDQGAIRQLQRSLVIKLLLPLVPHLRRK